MKTIATLIATLFAVTAFAADAPKTAETKPATAPAVTASPAPNKTEKKAKTEVVKADATKSAASAPSVAKDTKTEAVKK